jgi:hypothetical protein
MRRAYHRSSFLPTFAHFQNDGQKAIFRRSNDLHATFNLSL